MWTQHFLPGHASIPEIEITKNFLLYSNPKAFDSVFWLHHLFSVGYGRDHTVSKKLKSALADAAQKDAVPKNVMSVDLRGVQTRGKFLSEFM